MEYKEEDFLQLSGLQHYRFCKRRWALIHIEHLWAENFRTADGAVFHENAHDTTYRESRGNLVVTRGVSVFSQSLGVSGQCDVVEYRRGEAGIPLAGKDGLWQPYPVEYKRGRPREDTGDALQLCAQAMCLEEMLCCKIDRGALYYGETKHRQEVLFSEELRGTVVSALAEMHELAKRGYTPKVKPRKGCNACSLKDLCLPKMNRAGSVEAYLKRMEALP